MQTYSFPALCWDFTNLVALSMHTIKQPVTLGSRVPLCPVFSTRKIRFNQATISWDDGLEGLSRFIKPQLNIKKIKHSTSVKLKLCQEQFYHTFFFILSYFLLLRTPTRNSALTIHKAIIHQEIITLSTKTTFNLPASNIQIASTKFYKINYHSWMTSKHFFATVFLHTFLLHSLQTSLQHWCQVKNSYSTQFLTFT